MKKLKQMSRAKTNRKKFHRPLVSSETRKTPMERINIDILVSNRNYSLNIREEVTQFSQAFTLNDKFKFPTSSLPTLWERV